MKTKVLAYTYTQTEESVTIPIGSFYGYVPVSSRAKHNQPRRIVFRANAEFTRRRESHKPGQPKYTSTVHIYKGSTLDGWQRTLPGNDYEWKAKDNEDLWAFINRFGEHYHMHGAQPFCEHQAVLSDCADLLPGQPFFGFCPGFHRDRGLSAGLRWRCGKGEEPVSQAEYQADMEAAQRQLSRDGVALFGSGRKSYRCNDDYLSVACPVCGLKAGNAWHYLPLPPDALTVLDAIFERFADSMKREDAFIDVFHYEDAPQQMTLGKPSIGS